MVLSLEEVVAAEENGSDKMRFLLRLRQSTDNFVIQCCADWEIQFLIHQQEKNSFKIYKYNCSVVHNPEFFHQVKHQAALIDAMNRLNV